MKIHLAGFFAVDAELFGVEILDQACETGCELACIKVVDEGNAALPVEQGLPAGFGSVAYRGKHPKPVTTTLRFDTEVVSERCFERVNIKKRPLGRFFQNRNLFLISGDVVDSRLNSGDLLGFFIRNFGIEFFFQRHYQFNGIQRVSAQVVDEGGSVLHVFFFNTQLFDDDFLLRVLRCCSAT